MGELLVLQVALQGVGGGEPAPFSVSSASRSRRASLDSKSPGWARNSASTGVTITS